ncbi:hypothetical protein NERG_00180 [Nematocida ausubeli]|uniref:Uncharacterized protein n=1 Tax=Nematocida ausubeli (strain ATCC PRA-371 / ERTm2) TaxID=1913371 RepID=H8Z9A9_NEMA1|nr:hypothetical protein NERG_00180 [Nematocida ausubeli]
MEVNRSVEENNQNEYLVEDATIQPTDEEDNQSKNLAEDASVQPTDEENIKECTPLQGTVIEIENPTTAVEATVVDINNGSEYLPNVRVQNTMRQRRDSGILKKCMTPRLFSCCFATAIGTLFLFSWASLISPGNRAN